MIEQSKSVIEMKLEKLLHRPLSDHECNVVNQITIITHDDCKQYETSNNKIHFSLRNAFDSQEKFIAEVKVQNENQELKNFLFHLADKLYTNGHNDQLVTEIYDKLKGLDKE